MKKSSVYIIDDSQMQVVLLEKILTREGYYVQTFSNGREFLVEFEKEMPTLIISDIDMPVMDGFELLQQIKRKACCRDIPFFFMSSHGDSAILDRAKKMGANIFLEKPFESELLVQSVKKVLN